MLNKINLIYLLGAGRSGTTLLATLLNNHSQIETLGEMHQLYEFIEEGKKCSCGENLKTCKEWSFSKAFLENNISEYRNISEKKEAHQNIFRLLLKNTEDKQYLKIQEEIFKHIQQERQSKWYVDSSKYIARFLLLKKSQKLNIKGVYIVRDPRGVVHSFQKKVQTSKAPLSALLYYNTINFFGEWVYRKHQDIMKVRYEDLVENPAQTLAKIYRHVFEEEIQPEVLPEYFKMPHIVGGNRMKTKQKIKIKPDKKWKSIKRYKQIFYYLIALPFSQTNKYKL